MTIIFALVIIGVLSCVMAAALFWLGWTFVFLCRVALRPLLTN
jgi:hypothetical protein